MSKSDHNISYVYAPARQSKKIDNVPSLQTKKPNHSRTAPPKAEAGPARKPVVGVLVTPRHRSKYHFPTGKDARIKKEMIESARKHGILMYFFYPRDLDWQKNLIKGHTLKTDGSKNNVEWTIDQFPFPDIVYNRLSFRRNEAQKHVRSLLNRLEKSPHIYLFNRRFLNKWEVHQSLAENSHSSALVPETRLLNLANLQIMADKYPELFIKPANKSIGKGIIKVERKDQSSRYLYKTAASPAKWNISPSVKHLHHRLEEMIDHDDIYMIQRGIDLATYKGRIFDLRVEVQKNGHGLWVFTGAGVRIAALGKYVTHVPNGGSRAVYEEIIHKVFGRSKSQIDYLSQQIKYICSVVPEVLENSLKITLGILSIDIGIERSGLMQVIEVNSKPSSFDENDIRQQHLIFLNEYFIHIFKSQHFMNREV